jgi:hypothetical protein
MEGMAEAGKLKTVRFLAVGKTSKGAVMALGQEVTIRWRGQRKHVRWKDDDVWVERGRAVLLVDGRERELRPFDPLDKEIIDTASFDGTSDRFVVIRHGKESGPSECRIIRSDGLVSECKLPAGYHFNIGYQYRDGKALRYFAFENNTRSYREINVETGEVTELTDPLSRSSLTHPPLQEPIKIGTESCPPAGAPLSPDGRVTVWQCAEVMECRGEGWTRQVRLPGALPVISELSPLSSRECLEIADAVAEIPWESYSFVWSHDGSRVYWCGKGCEWGYVIDRNCETVVTSPCLRAATWTSDDLAVIGVTKCGHEITEWPAPATRQPNSERRGTKPAPR